MEKVSKIKELKILYLSSFPPRKCGIADFCQNVIEAIHQVNPNVDQKVVAINELNAPRRDYPALVKWILQAEDPDSYQKTALWINESGADVLVLQHEYGLFGGFDGIFLLKLLEKVKIPIVSLFHSVPVLKSSKKRSSRLFLLKEISKKSSFVLTFAQRAKRVLIKEVQIPQEKIFVVRHWGYGVPYPEKKEKERLKRKYGFEKKFLILSYGLITKSKGFHFVIEAMKEIKRESPNVLYLILGEPHPIHVRATERDYFFLLQRAVKNAKLERNVKFISGFIPKEKLIEYLKMPDLVILPYKVKEQTSSGVLANAMTTGNCILSTPFVYAKEMLKNQRGFFIEFENPNSIAKQVIFLAKHPEIIEKTRKKAYQFAQNFTDKKVAQKYLQICQKAKSFRSS